MKSGDHIKKIIRTVIALIAFALIFFNIGPFLTNGQINIGILTGLTASLLCFTYCILFDKINNVIRGIWKKPSAKIFLTVTAVFVFAAACFAGYTMYNIVNYSKQTEKKTEYIIVLGCQVNDTQPGRYLRARINKAYEYLKDNPDSRAILSGGQGSDENISEAQCMFNTLTGYGIEPDRLIMEDKSTSTMENFSNSLKILESEGKTIDEIIVVTNDFHEYRASKFAEMNGLTSYPYPSKTPWIGYLPFAVREIYAVIAQIYF